MSTSIAPDSILHDLSQMWTSLGKQESGAASEAGVLRACSLTLVVVAAPGEDSMALGETLAALMPRHPSRAIVIRLEGSDAPSANVTAQCWMPFGQHRQICCEQIELRAAENGLDDLASILGPIAAPDLPLILWCRGKHALDAPSFAHLAAQATRVVVDTGAWPDPKQAIRKLAEVARTVPVGDLSWTRLTRWREMLAQVFENPQYASRIPEIRNIRVTCGGDQAPSQAYYMAAWTADALRRSGAKAEFALVTDPDVQAGDLQTVELSDDGFNLTLTHLRETLIATVNSLSRCIRLPAGTDHVLMNEELDIVRRDPVFERTLAAAVQLLPA